MTQSASIGVVTFELGHLLRRTIWQPMHRTMEIFHLLPPAAAVILLLLLFDVGQLREIYLSYLEELNVIRIAWALAGFVLISALLYQSHYWLSTMRINVIYSSLSYPNAGTNLRNLQRAAAFAWSLFPWAGLAAGLFLARDYLSETGAHLQAALATDAEVSAALHTVPEASTPAIITSVIALGGVVGALFDFYRQNRLVQGAIISLTPIAATSVFLLLIDSYPQLSTIGQQASAAAILALVSVSFYAVHYLIETRRIKFVYSSFWYRDTGINPRRRQRLAKLAWALIPWLAVGLYFAKDFLAKLIGSIAPGLATSLQSLPTAGDLAIIPEAIIYTVAAGLLVALTMDAHRQNLPMRRAIGGAIILAIAVAATMPLLGLNTVSVYRWVGPLGTMALAFLFIFSNFVVLALLSQKSGFPAVKLVLTAVALSALFNIQIATMAEWLCGACALFVILALVSRLWAVALVAGLLGVLAFCTVLRERQHYVQYAESALGGIAVDALEARFDDWIQNRADRAPADRNKPYPVFIISAEGGGIYAAAAASLFLAKLQDDCPAFAQHVFAISAVSGGAIGATIFQALSQSLPAATAADCRPRADTEGSLTRKVASIMQEDHFSPVVGSIVPDFLGERMGRAEALEQSFEQWGRFSGDAAVKRLAKEAGFIDHWSSSGAAPALVLNTTWAETGYRVAFAPFTFRSSTGNDGTLYSFADADMPGQNISLLDAAVVSARFPGILPPYSVKMTSGETGPRRWNFVDGGYSDLSGAATALAIFNALQPASCKHNVDLKVILLASANPKPNFQTLNGTDFLDTMAPIDAVMKVRELLGNQAVTRASDYFTKPVPCENRQPASDWQLQQIKLQEQEYSLPLGWKISSTTFGLVSWLIGHPEPCETATLQVSPGGTDDKVDRARANKQALKNNRCVMRLIEDALSAK